MPNTLTCNVMSYVMLCVYVFLCVVFEGILLDLFAQIDRDR